MMITKNVKITVPLKCLSNFWRTLNMTMINCEANLILTWSENLANMKTDAAVPAQGGNLENPEKSNQCSSRCHTSYN